MTYWWLNDMPPISGILRFVLYGGLLVLCLVDSPSPLGAPKIMAGTEPLFYTPTGLVRLLRLRWVSPAVLTVIVRITVVVWVAAALGFLQPVTGILTCLGFAFLHSTNAGALGANHSTHSALYALICLSFSVSYGFSLDGLLAEHAGWPLLVSTGSPFESGFAPLLLLIFLAYTLFSGGVSKLRNGGLRWFNGRALRYYLEQSASAARWPWLSRQAVARPGLCRLMATGAVLVELSAVLAIVVSPLRMPLILVWAGLHISILLVMMPAYWVQMWCYLALLDWPWITHALGGPKQPATVFATSGAGPVVFTVVGLGACLTLVLVLLLSSEEWPFTAVPMYSNGIPAEEIPLPAPTELRARAIRARRRRHNAWERAWVSDEVMEDIWLGEPGAAQAVSLTRMMYGGDGPRLVRWSQYTKVVRGLAIADVIARPAGGTVSEPDSQEYPAAHFLRSLAGLARERAPHWARYGSLRLACRTREGWTVLATVGLDAEAPAGKVGETGRGEHD